MIRYLMLFLIALITQTILPFPLQAKQQNLALIAVPVADLIGKPMAENDFIPIDGKNDRCPRLHQVLYNEVVELLKIEGSYAYIKVLNCFHLTRNNPKTIHNTYWIDKENLVPFSILPKNAHDYIPQPIDWQTNQKTDQSSIVLIMPWHDIHKNIIYSVGTRFVCDAKNSDAKNFTVYILDHQKKFVSRTIPADICRKESDQKNLSCKQKIANYVQLIKSWTRQPNGSIPYVWGGCSFTQIIPLTVKNNIIINGSYIDIPEFKACPFAGFDCTGLVLRATQICDIPYYFKNSTTVAHYLQALKKNEEIEPGDLIWMPGHIMLVADKEKNTVLEASTAYYGFGDLHELPLAKEFKNITTFQELHDAFFAKKPIKRINAQGIVIQDIPEFKLLRIASAWQAELPNK